ncbi:unnamed protein product [Psylliodes chrysocephalus]|uniref:Uncharacterized protein n=1 Tax=Psylliodes chrysocephalus TaxID=3402493 RepID=A0A9P0G6Q6_9CUCU|nr:unnamed protein product [Psylliodes chrysocephala]
MADSYYQHRTVSVAVRQESQRLPLARYKIGKIEFRARRV